MPAPYYDNAEFESIVRAVTNQKDTDKFNPGFGGLWIGHMSEENISMYENILERDKKELKDREIALNLCRIANRLGVNFSDGE